MQSITKNIAITLTAQVPAIVFGIISGILTTRLLGPEGKGVFALYLANVEILALLFSFGTEQGIVYFISNKKINVYKIQALSIIVFLVSILLNSTFIFMTSSNLVFIKDYSGIFFRLYVLLLFILTFYNSLIIAFLKAKKKFKQISFITIISTSINLISFLTYFLLVRFNKVENSIRFVFIIGFCLIIINGIIYSFYFTRNYKFKPNFKISLNSDVLPFYKFSFLGYAGMLVNFLNYRFDIWLVSYFKGAIQLGFYSLAVNFSQLIMLFSRIFSGVMTPYLASSNTRIRNSIFLTYSRINFSIIVLIVVVLSFTGDYLLVFMYGVDFAESVAPFKILLAGMIFTGASQIYSAYVSTSGRNDLCLYTNLIGLFFTVVLDFILIPRYGIVGSAYATAISYFTIFLTYLLFISTKLNVNITSMFIIQRTDFSYIMRGVCEKDSE